MFKLIKKNEYLNKFAIFCALIDNFVLIFFSKNKKVEFYE